MGKVAIIFEKGLRTRIFPKREYNIACCRCSLCRFKSIDIELLKSFSEFAQAADCPMIHNLHPDIQKRLACYWRVQ